MFSTKLLCRADQTFRWPVSLADYHDRIVAGSAVRLHFLFPTGYRFALSSESADAAQGSFEYNTGTKIGWFVAPLSAVVAIPHGFSKPVDWALRIDRLGAGQVIMGGSSLWRLPVVAMAADATSTQPDADVGQTVFIEGVDSGPANPWPPTLADAVAAAQAAYAPAAIAANLAASLASLPTTLPATAGVLWNNGGAVSIS